MRALRVIYNNVKKNKKLELKYMPTLVIFHDVYGETSTIHIEKVFCLVETLLAC